MIQTNEEKFLQLLASKIFKTECLVLEDKGANNKSPKLGIELGRNYGWISLKSETKLLLNGSEVFFALNDVLTEDIPLNLSPAPKLTLQNYLIESDNKIIGRFTCTFLELSEIFNSNTPQTLVFQAGCLILKSDKSLYASIQGNIFKTEYKDGYFVIGRNVMEEVRIDVVLGALVLPLERLLAIRPGDIIELSNFEEVPINLQVGSIPVADGFLKNNQIEISKLYTKLSTTSYEQSI